MDRPEQRGIIPAFRAFLGGNTYMEEGIFVEDPLAGNQAASLS